MFSDSEFTTASSVDSSTESFSVAMVALGFSSGFSLGAFLALLAGTSFVFSSSVASFEAPRLEGSFEGPATGSGFSISSSCLDGFLALRPAEINYT